MCPINSANSLNDLDLVVVPVISLNPKKAKKKLKKAAHDEGACVDSRLPVNKIDADLEVVPPVSLNPKKATKKLKTAATVPQSKISSPPRSAECTPTLKLDGLSKKSWYDITMDDDDDFCGAFSNY